MRKLSENFYIFQVQKMIVSAKIIRKNTVYGSRIQKAAQEQILGSNKLKRIEHRYGQILSNSTIVIWQKGC